MKIQENKAVLIHYTLKNDDGEILDSSEGQEPLAYLHGHGNLIPGLEDELEGKVVGDVLRVSIPPEKGYGLHDSGQIIKVPKSKFGEVEEIAIGMQIEAHTSDGQRVFTVQEVAADTVTLDGNHPLAGKTLHFNVSVQNVRDASPEEINHRHVH
ncbi:MAG: peptidylprolyl isomerase [Spirochaetales bacterium]|nr:MAG: peptidylprolyl isomerase [Spirochaetales bacterium]